MTEAVKQLVDQFAALPARERQEVLAELLRRARSDSHDLSDDDDLVAAADVVFQELDRREQGR